MATVFAHRGLHPSGHTWLLGRATHLRRDSAGKPAGVGAATVLVPQPAPHPLCPALYTESHEAGRLKQAPA